MGVEVEIGAETLTIEGGEIVICAGAVASPQLLMLSGIGPADHLSNLGLSVIHPSPGVGQNMRDHCSVGVSLAVHEGFQLYPYGPRLHVTLRYSSGDCDDTSVAQTLRFQSQSRRVKWSRRQYRLRPLAGSGERHSSADPQ